uniref:Uncharacterized protein n=1 Tax=Periophthalmus magnuspinnatus TaxID=409849 RepID=A0A3B4AAA9_9GOBI
MAAAVLDWTTVIFIVLPNISMLWGKVSKDLPPECRQFYYLGVPPRGLEHPSQCFICQHYNKRARYVTLYNTALYTPIYSAYTFKHSAGEVCANVPWMYEPQLFRPGATHEMQPVLQVDQGTQPYEQAGLSDYMNAAVYERAPLNPDVHQEDPDDKASTYTLTNTVPLTPDFIDPIWSKQEQAIRTRLNNYCRGPSYIITGVTTSGRTMRGDNMKRVAVPAYLWSAYCCPNYDHSAPFSVRYKFPAFAQYGLNAEKDNEVLEVSVQKLQDFLKNIMSEQNIQIFVNDCALPGDTK